MPLYFLDQHNLSGVFQLTSVIVNETTYEKFDGVIKSSEFRAHTGYHAYMFNISRDRDTKLQAFTFSWKYFADFEPDIRSEFRFKPDILTKADTILRAKLDKLGIVGSSTTFIGVHIRRGDIVEKKWVDIGTLQPPLSYYYKAMDYYIKEFGQYVVFVFCSDGILWVKQNFQNVSTTYDMVFMDGRNSWGVDMAILSRCNHSIISTGTFGWWAAYLAGGRTVHYRYMVREDSPMRKSFSETLEDYFYLGWISME